MIDENIRKIGLIFFAVGMILLGVQQVLYQEFLRFFAPFWPSWLPGRSVWAVVFGLDIAFCAAMILSHKKIELAAIALSATLLFLFVAFEIPNQILYNANIKHPGTWIDPLKLLALLGGALIVAGFFPNESELNKMGWLSWLRRWVSVGSIFFGLMMLSFGIDHFLYVGGVSQLVPAWMPWKIFWTYFTGTALSLSGLAFILRMQTRLAGLLAGGMIFAWVILLHIPRAIADPSGANGNEVTSVFQAVGFSGICLMIATIKEGK